jgi:hypothetical protein
MGALPPPSFAKLLEQANQFFEAQLEAIGLGRDQIEQQSIADLEDSLVRVDDALRAPESFGVIRLRLENAVTGFVIVKSDSAALFERGVVPLLLERKRAIVDRLRRLRAERTITNLSELIDSIADQRLQERLRTELEATRQNGGSGKSAARVRQGYGFIAMAMDPQEPQLEDVLDAIKAGAAQCGIAAERIDEARSNEPITKRMLDSISEAEFVFVDLTHPRPNVYYEAGYAQGNGKTPVFLARVGTIIPFDLKDYPVIFYPNMRELRASIAERLTSIRFGRK